MAEETIHNLEGKNVGVKKKKPDRETKRDKFVRLAEARTNKIIEMLKLLGNCSSRASYEYTDEDVRKIFGEIEREMKNAKSRFQSIDSADKKFKL